jgi:endonuclease/exonuclease/phosphatase family metal-dependent hydrolase
MVILLIGSLNVFADTSNSFSVLSYNVAGLPDILSSGNPEINTIKISSLLNGYDIVAVQEDFAYHSDLIENANHEYLTETSGNVPYGDGLNFLSNFFFYDVDRITWNERYGLLDSGSDELTPKGFMYAQYMPEEGVYIDIYTLHTDAGSDSGSYEARRDNITQISDYILENSQGNAVIVLGDTNSRYTRSEDNFEEALLKTCNLNDPWIDIIRDGVIPEDGSALMDTSDLNGENYEVVDKIFYRSSKSIDLNAINYKLEDEVFVDENGEQLSDHYPITSNLQYEKTSDYLLSTLYGGTGGSPFNFIDDISDSEIETISLRSGTRVDGISLSYSDNIELSCGGAGGTVNSLDISDGDYIKDINISIGTKSDTDRVFYIEIITNEGNVLEGGTQTDNNESFSAPSGYYIAGFFGRDGDELDKLGVIYKKIIE